MKAVVMAGGEGTRLRPLTSNQPKPMVPIVGKPCMEHILELLREHGFDDVIVTVAFLPQAIRSYFGDGESLGLNIEYSVEEIAARHRRLGAARAATGSTRRSSSSPATRSATSTSTELVDFHKEKGAAVTIGLKSVENPLEFGIVVTDEDGRDRALPREAVVGPGLLGHDQHRHLRARARGAAAHARPTGRTTSRRSSSRCCSRWAGRSTATSATATGRTSATSTSTGRRTSTRSTSGRARTSRASSCAANVWVGEGVEIDDVEGVEGPAFIGNYCRDLARVVGRRRTRCSAPSVTLRERARTVALGDRRVDATSAAARVVEGAIVGRNCDIRSHARVHEGVAIGDEVTLGAQSRSSARACGSTRTRRSSTGAQIHESLIWESRAPSRLFGKDGVSASSTST